MPEGAGERPRPALPNGRADGGRSAMLRQPFCHLGPPGWPGATTGEMGPARTGRGGGRGSGTGTLSLASFFALQSWRERQERFAAAEKARQEKLEEKQRLAVNDILGGDFEVAEEAIRQAE